LGFRPTHAPEKTSGVIFGSVSVPVFGGWEAVHSVGEQRAKKAIARHEMQGDTEYLQITGKEWRPGVRHRGTAGRQPGCLPGQGAQYGYGNRPGRCPS
jgi:hypothetical protein